MIDITGKYDLHDGTNVGLTIGGVDPTSGALLNSFVTDPNNALNPITGFFDSTSNQINFSMSLFPGTSFFATFYTGLAIGDLTAIGQVVGLSGTWHSLRTTRPPGGPLGPVIPVQVSGGWFADNHTPPPVLR